jgi:signal transduction histidine kinase
MVPPVSDVRTHSLLLGAIFTWAIAASILLRKEKSNRLDLFVWYGASLALWYSLQVVNAWWPAWYWERLAAGALVLLPQTATRFFRAFIGDEVGPSRLVRVGTALGVLALAYVASPLWNTRATDPLLFAYAAGLLAAATLVLHVRTRRLASRVEGARAQLLVIGGALALVFSLLDYLPYVGVDFPPVGPVLAPIFMYALSLALLRHRLFDLYELIGRFAVLTAMALGLAGIFSVLVLWAETSRWFFLNAIAAAFVILIVFDPLRSMVEQKIGEIMLRERSGYEARLLALRRRLGRLLTTGEIAHAVITVLEETRRYTHGSIYLLTGDGLTLARRGHFGPEPAAGLEVAAARPLLDALAGAEAVRRGTIVEQRESRATDGEAAAVEALDAVLHRLDDLRADLVLPVRGEQRILGLLALRDERLPGGPGEDDVKVLAPVAIQTAIAAENIELYQRMKFRDRMAVVGEMAAGLAHEIRNPLGAIKAAAQILAEDEPRSVRSAEMIAVLIEESNRLNRVLGEFLDYARARPDPAARGDVAAVLRRCVQMIRAEHGEGLDIDLGISASLPVVPVDGERLLQVFLNLGLNAANAMDGRGRLEIIAMLRRDSIGPGRGQPGPGRVLVRFRDHGSGIPPEVLPRIFIPFFTTRARGTGLGLALTQRIVEEAGGTIEVHSEPGRGTDFTVVLPAVEGDPPPPAGRPTPPAG